jgi:hypothetical protein
LTRPCFNISRSSFSAGELIDGRHESFSGA